MYDVWTHDGSRPELLGSREDKVAARRLLAATRHGAIASGGSVLELRDSCGSAQAKALRAAVAYAWTAAGGAPTAPLFVGPVPGNKIRTLEHAARRVDAAPSAAPAKPARPAAVRPPLQRRQVAPVAAPCVDDELATLRHRIEQLTGQAEALTSDRAVARRDAANALVRAIDAERERDEARCLADEALTEGLRASERAAAAPVAVPAPVLLDEFMLARVATRAAREAVRVTRDDARLRALAESVGGIDALETRIAGTERLLRRLA